MILIYTIRLDFMEGMPTLMVNPGGLDNDRFKMIGEKLSRKVEVINKL